MGLILDSSVLIAGERRGETVRQVIERLQRSYGEVEAAVSVISIIELTHGIFRAKSDAAREKRQRFVDEVSRDFIVHPVSLPIGQLAGQIEGEQAAKGIAIAFEDLIIGATALHLGFDLATENIKHFQLIPGLRVIQR